MNNLKIKAIGVGGAGGNIVNELFQEEVVDIDFCAINTDAVALKTLKLEEKYILGKNQTRGLSVGGDYEFAANIGEEEKKQLEAIVEGYDLVFIILGAGGGTGTGVAPLLSKIVKESGGIVLCFAVLPFNIEGKQRIHAAEIGVSRLRFSSHGVIVLPNDVLLKCLSEEATIVEAFMLANTWVIRGITSIVNMLMRPGLINVDFQSLKSVLRMTGGKTLFALGQGKGEDAYKKALNELKLCPLMNIPESAKSADGLIINIVGGKDLKLKVVNEIAKYVTEQFSSYDNTLIGAIIDEEMNRQIEICVIGITDLGRRNILKGSQRTSENVGQQVLFDESNISEKKHFEIKLNTSEEIGRGYFEDCIDEELFMEIDIDIPAYYRKGIKID